MNPTNELCALLLAVALATGGFYEGWSMRGDHEAAVQLRAKKLADKALDKERVRGDDLAIQLEVARREVKTVTVEVVKEIPKVTTVYKESPNAPLQPIPDPVYTVGFVRLWNDAYASSGVRSGAGKPAGAAGEADLVRAPVSSADLLANHAENAGKHADCYAQLNKLIDFEEGRERKAE
jgi:hypothetical protein